MGLTKSSQMSPTGKFRFTENGITTRGVFNTRDGFNQGMKEHELCVVYSHGLNSRSTTPHIFFDALTERLVKQGANVIRPDFIGCGINKEAGSFVDDYTSKKGSQQLLDAITWCAPRGSTIRIVARSMGIMPAALLSVDKTLEELGYNLDKIAVHAGAGRMWDILRYNFTKNILRKKGIDTSRDFYADWKRYYTPELIEKMAVMWPSICKMPGEEMPLDFINEHSTYGRLLTYCFDPANILWIHGDNDQKVPFPISGWSDIPFFPRANFVCVQNGTHELDTPEEMNQYMDRLVQFLIS